jgi:putative DNA primase/helicase
VENDSLTNSPTPCTAIVVHETVSDGASHNAEPNEATPRSKSRPIARKVGRSELAWELIDLAEGMDVRHGTINGESQVFVCIESITGAAFEPQWAGTREARFRKWLAALCYHRLQRGPTAAVLDEVVAHIEARGFGLPAEPIARRVTGHDGSIWISLGPEDERVVEITPNGWAIVEDAPVLFLPAENAGTLPVPVPGGKLELLRRYFPNVQDADWPSLVGFIIATYLPDGALPILALSGPKNSGKSMTTELIRAICDPVVGLDARSAFPDNVEDVFTIASTTHVLSFDNLSRIDKNISDALCTVTTGAARQTRRFYAQGSLHTSRARNPVILNGISTGIEREDLVSRTVFIDLQPIPDAARRKESLLRNDFRRDLPEILGALLDGVAMALRDGQATTIAPAHRLEDAACFATAAEPVLGFTDGAIVDAWLRSQDSTQEDLGSVDPLVEVLSRLMFNCSVWNGSASILLKQAVAMSEGEDAVKLPKDFPLTARQIGEQLLRKKDVLKRAGFTVMKARTNDARLIKIERKIVAEPITRVSVVRPTEKGEPR